MTRARDIVIATIALAMVAPLLLLTMLLLRIAQGRPVMFSQVRSGLDGVPFRVPKLRTMTSAVDAAGHLLPDAQRITPLGRLLRRTRIDELPQLICVITGRMSLIGPRPLPPVVLAQAPESAAARGRVRPGLTGWAQVNGNARLADADKLALDVWYVDNRSARLDLTIVVRTLAVLLRGEHIDTHAIRRAHAGGPDRRG